MPLCQPSAKCTRTGLIFKVIFLKSEASYDKYLFYHFDLFLCNLLYASIYNDFYDHPAAFHWVAMLFFARSRVDCGSHIFPTAGAKVFILAWMTYGPNSLFLFSAVHARFIGAMIFCAAPRPYREGGLTGYRWIREKREGKKKQERVLWENVGMSRDKSLLLLSGEYR